MFFSINIIMNFVEDKLNSFQTKSLVSDIKISNLETFKIRTENCNFLKNVLFEKGCKIDCPNFALDANTIFIGAYSSIRDGSYMRDNFFMGRHSGLGRRCSVAAGIHNISGVSINSDTIMAKISNYTDEELEYLGYRRDQTSVSSLNNKPVVIENDVFLGDGVIVMPGITIGTGSVIAANTVVTDSIPPYSVVGGIPGKVIRDRFPEDIKVELLKTKWWNAKLEVLKSLPVDNVFKFIKEFNKLDDSIWDDIKTLEYV